MADWNRSPAWRNLKSHASGSDYGGQEVSEAVVELIAEKLRIVGRATEDGSLGWKVLLQHVADDAKGASGNLAG